MRQFKKAALLFCLVCSTHSIAEERLPTPNADSSGSEKAALAAGGVTAAGIGVAASTVSAATITSTLAVVGGGSMAVGVGVVAAVPLVVGAAAYGLWSWMSDDEEPEKSK